jgi:AraC-type DNA-binding domain-containing proteins
MDTQKMTGFYELRRDETSHVVAWRVENDAFMPHFHSAFELMYVEEGEIIALQEGVFHTLSKGEMAVNSSYMVHSYSTPAHSRSLVATIPLSAVPSLKAMLAHHSFKEGIVDTRGMKECHRILRMMAEPGNRANERFVNCLAEALLAYLVEKIGLIETPSEAAEDLMKHILRYMQKNAAEPLSIAKVAAHFGYSVGRFSHIFNERVGSPFTRYLNFLRCRMAQGLLDTTDSPLIDVANQSGFSSLRTFHRVYKDFTGHTPRLQAAAEKGTSVGSNG